MATSGAYSWSLSEKVCYTCKSSKSLDQFYSHKTTKDKKTTSCIECCTVRSRQWYLNNKEKHAEAQKKWQSNNQEAQRISAKKWRDSNKDKTRAQHLNKKYDMTPDDYNALFEQQDGRCLGCMTHQSELSKPLYVDHNHKNGYIRGLLCHSCNSALGYAKDDPVILGYLIDYLKGTK